MRITASKAARRTLFAAAALSLGLAVSSSAPAQDEKGTADVIVYPANGDGPIRVSLDDVDPVYRVHATYKVRRRPGAAYEGVPVNGFTVQGALKAAGVGDDVYTYVQTLRDDGSHLKLSRTYVRTGDAPPVIYRDSGGSIHLLVNSSGPNDPNSDDWIDQGSGPLTIRQTVSGGLKVKVTVSDKQISAGDSVELTAEVTNLTPGDVPEIQWDYGDGSKVRRGQPTIDHIYKDAGSYTATAHVKTHDDSGDGEAPRIVVGDPPAADTTGGSGAAGPAPTVSGGGVGTPSTTYDYTTDPSPSIPSADPPTYKPLTSSYGPTVSGNLLADVSLPSSSPPATASEGASSTAPDDEDVDPAGIPTAAWAAIAALALMGVGASLESGRPRRLRLAGLPSPRTPRLRLRRR